MKWFLRQPSIQAGFAWLLGLYLAFALRTTRWRIEGEEHIAPHFAGAPCVAAFWHEYLPLMPMLWVLGRQGGATGRPHVLVSRHRDGRFIGEVIRRFGVTLVYGSSTSKGRSRGGAAGVRALLAVLAQGDHVVLTPDGPRGPRRVAAPGAAQLAALGQVPLVPMAAQSTSRHRLGSWDRMVLPLPFGRGVIVCGTPLLVPREDWQDWVAPIEAALNAVSDRAERVCAA
jgi:lysophospholipid acyltransferase (LPLAT)-like uncharacterized protein